MKTILIEAIHRESILNKLFEATEKPYNPIHSTLWVMENKTMTEVADYSDVYNMLDSKEAKKLATKFGTITVVTAGWAAPLETDEDCPPSEHSQRRRVRLAITATKNGVASVLRFSDTPDEIITDEGTAKGSLADAITNLFKTKKKGA